MAGFTERKRVQIKAKNPYRVAHISQAFDHTTGEHSDKNIVLTLESDDGTTATVAADREHHPQIGDKFELTLTSTTVVQKTS